MLQVYRPPPDMSHWVDGAVVVRLGAALGASHFPAMPHAMLTLRLAAPPGHGAGPLQLCPPITFHTLSTVPTVHPHAGDLLALGLLVRPAAAASLLGRTTGALVDQVLDWAVLAGDAEAARLAQEIAESRTQGGRVGALLDSFRRTMARTSAWHDTTTTHLCAAVGRHGAAAGEHLGIGARQLERRCQALLGLPPKRFQRLVRLHGALSQAVSATTLPGAELALNAGYYDQSHLARDVRALAGRPLGALLSAARPDSPWWALASHRLLPQAGQVLLPGHGPAGMPASGR